MRFLRVFFVLTGMLCVLPLTSQGQPDVQAAASTTSTVRNRAAMTIAAPVNGSLTSRTVAIRFPQGTLRSSVKVSLNGTVVSARFREETCTGALCLSADLSTEDGVAPGQNIVYATAKNQDGTASSSRLHFTGGDATVQADALSPSTSAHAMARNAPVGDWNLPTNSTFLPPSVLFQTISNGGVYANEPWFTLGSRQQLNNGNCSSAYSVLVLDRRTLQPKTTTPENSPQCFANSGQLVPYLQSLAANNDIVIVGTNFGQDTDVASGAFDTSSIGGTKVLHQLHQ